MFNKPVKKIEEQTLGLQLYVGGSLSFIENAIYINI